MATLVQTPSVFRQIPLMAVILLVYNIAMSMGHDFNGKESPLIHFHLISGAEFTAGWNELLLVAALIIVFVEILLSTYTTIHSLVEHMLSMFVFIAFLVEFLVARGAGTHVFFLLSLMSLIDVMAGYSISIAVARKDLNIVQ